MEMLLIQQNYNYMHGSLMINPYMMQSIKFGYKSRVIEDSLG